MKCLCFSDSHGNSHNIRRVLNMHPDAEVIFFLGDGLSDLELFISDRSRAFLAVRGNCDRTALLGDNMVKKTDEITILGHRIVFTHGDLYGVKFGIGGAINLAKEKSADIVLFGHTHTPLEKYVSEEDRGIYLFNPGSIGGSFFNTASYGLINITEQGVLFSHGTL